MTAQTGNGGERRAPESVERHADELFARAGEILGERLAEVRLDPDRGLRVTVIDLTDSDRAALETLGRRFGADAWLRIERADPVDLEMWERLRHEIRALMDSGGHQMMVWPVPDPGYRRPPVEIRLSAEAESIAAGLHERYGNFVSLTVGALPYPPGAVDSRLMQVSRRAMTNRVEVNPDELRCTLDGPLSVRSGETVTHGLLLTNLGDSEVRVGTNGSLTANIIDPDSGEIVGGYAGAQHLPLVVFTAKPAATVRIPLLVGTASYTPRLGYALPPGRWQLIAPLSQRGDSQCLVTPPLEFTIT